MMEPFEKIFEDLFNPCRNARERCQHFRIRDLSCEFGEWQKCKTYCCFAEARKRIHDQNAESTWKLLACRLLDRFQGLRFARLDIVDKYRFEYGAEAAQLLIDAGFDFGKDFTEQCKKAEGGNS